MRKLLKNTKIINHNNSIDGHILIEDSKILDIITDNSNITADEVIDCKNMYTLPGFIDMHVHAREPGFEYKEDINSVAKSAIAGGVTTLCCMANTKPVIDNAQVVNYIYNKAKIDGLIDILPYGAVTKGINGKELTEMGDILEAGACGFSDDGYTIMNSEVMRRGLEYASHFGSFIASHAIDINLQGDGSMNEGKVSALTGLKGIPSESETTIVVRDILLAKLTKSRVHICHISTKETVNLLRWAKNEGINVTAEVAPHHFSLTDEMCINYDTNCKMSPPLRTEEDCSVIIQGLKDGVVDCIATDHAPHQADEKFVEFDNAPVGVIGLQTLIPLTLKLIESGKLSWNDFAKLSSYNPAKILKKDSIGEIIKGKNADITVIDPNSEYIFNEKVNFSKSINTPYWNKSLKGRSVYTFKNGNLVFSL